MHTFEEAGASRLLFRLTGVGHPLSVAKSYSFAFRGCKYDLWTRIGERAVFGLGSSGFLGLKLVKASCMTAQHLPVALRH